MRQDLGPSSLHRLLSVARLADAPGTNGERVAAVAAVARLLGAQGISLENPYQPSDGAGTAAIRPPLPPTSPTPALPAVAGVAAGRGRLPAAPPRTERVGERLLGRLGPSPTTVATPARKARTNQRSRFRAPDRNLNQPRRKEDAHGRPSSLPAASFCVHGNRNQGALG